MKLTGDFLVQSSSHFNELLSLQKGKADLDWYPYGILNNFIHLQEIFNEFPLDAIAGKRIMDIGGADGDLAFFLSSLNFELDVIEYPSTNFNSCKGIRYLNTVMHDKINITELDIDNDSKELLPEMKFELIFFLGILYHLRNPVQVLANLSKKSQYMLLSTRIARFADNVLIEKMSVAYLLGATESNNDATNWWIFSKKGLEQLFERTGWEIIHSKHVGDVENSNPSDMSKDERYFGLLRSKNFNQ
jgi:2-polyprenyl-3-methyl-5-hydroxy-6-metoxy-1,4-benzoquinol methylase